MHFKKDVFTLSNWYDLALQDCDQLSYLGSLNEPTELWTWGLATCGGLGNDDTANNMSSPIQLPGITWNDISVGGACFSLARKCDGTLWAWGWNDGFGNLGDNTRVDKFSPIQVPGTTWNAISAGYCFALARKTDSTLWSWGRNSNGQLGDITGSAAHKSSPVQIPGTTWSVISAGGDVGGALKTNGTLWLWGLGTCGAIGDGTVISRSSPTQLPGINWCHISASIDQSFAFGMALKTDGSLWSWGYNGHADLGDNTVINRSSPVQIPGLTWSNVCAGWDHAVALKTDGTLWIWGGNDQGQIGNNTALIYYSSPIQIPGLTWTDAYAGKEYTMGQKNDGSAWVWGFNDRGQFGINGLYFSSPVQIPGINWVCMSLNCNVSAGLKTVQ